MSHTRLRRPSRPFVTPTLLDLPREVIRNIALHIYDPLELSQQDRLSTCTGEVQASVDCGF
jgi:hypothetical protein